jgi:hypothetical protein
MEGARNFKKDGAPVAKHFRIPHRKGTSPAKTLIDATFPALDPKQKSRWSRALELAALAKATPEQLPNLFKNHSGIAGCARWAAEQKPKKETYRDDWANEHSVERDERIAQRKRAREVGTPLENAQAAKAIQPNLQKV